MEEGLEREEDSRLWYIDFLEDAGDEYVEDHEENDDEDTDDSDDAGDTRAFLEVSLGKMVCNRLCFELFLAEFDLQVE